MHPVGLARRLRRRLRPVPETPRRGLEGPLFDAPFYTDITTARLEHFDRMDLDLAGRRVVDVGAGIGRLSAHLADRAAEVVCVDGREENIEILRAEYPERTALVVDVETDALLEIGQFDVVFCYGLLYHLVDPLGFLRRAATICEEMLVLETCILDSAEPEVRLIDEYEDPTMGLYDTACRPSPAYVVRCLGLAGFAHVYSPHELPAHQDFQYRRKNDGSIKHNDVVMRDIFVATRAPLDNARLQRIGPEPGLPQVR